jgi:AcrR family transcriptional regulator
VTSSKRQAIMDGMLETVGAESYDRTAVRSVLDRTGFYRQSFYDNFADKYDCYLQAYDEVVVRIERELRAAASGEIAWRDRLRAGLGALLDFLDAEPDIGRALIVEVHAAGPEALAKRTAALQKAQAFLDRGGARGGLEPPPIAGEGIVAGILAVVHSQLCSGDGDLRRLLPEFMYFAVLPYFGAEVAGAELQAAGV